MSGQSRFNISGQREDLMNSATIRLEFLLVLRDFWADTATDKPLD